MTSQETSFSIFSMCRWNRNVVLKNTSRNWPMNYHSGTMAEQEQCSKNFMMYNFWSFDPKKQLKKPKLDQKRQFLSLWAIFKTTFSFNRHVLVLWPTALVSSPGPFPCWDSVWKAARRVQITGRLLKECLIRDAINYTDTIEKNGDPALDKRVLHPKS